MEVLFLSLNKITEIKGLDGLTNLSAVNLDGNQITEIKGLESLQNLMQIDLSTNQMTKVPDANAFKNFENLSTIFFWNNGMSLDNIKRFKQMLDLLKIELDYELNIPPPLKTLNKLRMSEVRKKLSQRKNDL